MGSVFTAVSAALAALFALTGLLGTWRWYRVEQSPLFWRLLRVGQALVAAYAAVVGVLVLAGRRPESGLFYVYALLPVAVSFVAEQLRLASADSVLAARDLDDAEAVGRLPADRQRSVVTAILRRELGVMALSALVVAGLLVRATTSA